MNKYLEQHRNYDVGFATQKAFISGYLYGKHQEQFNKFEELQPEATLQIEGDIILSHPEREVLMDFLLAFGGDWKKEVETYDHTKVNYSQSHPHPFLEGESYYIKAQYASPPPSCEIVEEDVVVPAQPETTKKVKKLKCKKEEAPQEVEVANETNP